jgi:hypothetical protein
VIARQACRLQDARCQEPIMKRTSIATACVAGLLAAAALAAPTQTPGTAAEPPRPAPTPSVGERTIDDPGGRPRGRVSETAPAPRPSSGAARVRADLASCQSLEPASQASCRREMHAARTQGLYRN